MTSTDASAPVVELRAATRTHGSVQVLAPTSLTLHAGGAAAVVGPNGSGKSTLLRLVAGADEPTSGSVRTLGLPAARARLRRREDVTLLLDGLPTYRDLTVAEHLQLVSSAWAGRHDLAGVAETLAAAELDRVRDQFPAELSSGERQLFALATTLYRPARLVLLDEPEQRLDSRWRTVARRLVGRALDAGRTVLVATHDSGLRDDVAARGQVLELAEPGRR
ncbi:ABC transporter family protein [Isoptericola sp. CG 20/1183]|uniref:ABC transporter family protein n=1 Tax=Isoptericola halotolerans TaxID=300560 RepID=A0ABX5EF34_9MICO|nr:MULTISPECIES: ATP-binding cassette domain-containing protein [Isoptericola]PRZ07717.1 ABC transporter family protein [Isoptericola halotolerans]PRZ07924.1 ABC transporter family protein [Isoptericola sp. CG 20/1183]